MDKPQSMLDWARYYASLGFSVIPVHTIDQDGICTCPKKEKCGSSGKHPAINWQRFTRVKADDDQLVFWFDGMEHSHSVGLVTGSISQNIFVIDVDIGNGKMGLESLDEVQMAHDDLPPTAMAKTGSGGRHLFFKAPEGFIVGTDKNVLGAGIDVRGEGGFVVAAPSPHVSGRRYEYDMDAILDAPTWLLAMVEGNAKALPGNAPKASDQNNWGKYDDGREAVMMKTILATIISYYESTATLPTIDELITHGWPVYEMRVATRNGRSLEEDGRGPTAFADKATYQLHRAQRGDLHILNTIRSKMESMGINNHINQGDTHDGKHVFTASNAQSSRDISEKTGHEFSEPELAHANESAFSAVIREAIAMWQESEVEASRKLNLSHWHATRYVGNPPEMEYLVDGIFPLGSPALLAASGGIGKSFALLDLALKIACNTDDPFHPASYAFGGKVLAKGTVVMLTAEDSKDSVHRRLQQIANDAQLEQAGKKLIVVPIPDATGPIALVNEAMGTVSMTEHFHALVEQLTQIDDLACVMIDPLQAFCWADINADPKAAQLWWTSMSTISAKTGATTLSSHHMRKDGLSGVTDAQSAREAIRGSSALVDGARLAYAMWALSGDAERPICQALKLPMNQQSVVCGCVVKANDVADRDVRFYARSEHGVLQDRTGEIEAAKKAANEMDDERMDMLFREIEKRWNREAPFSNAAQSGERYVVRWMETKLKLSRQAAKRYVDNWIDEGVLGIELLNSSSKQKGLCVMHRPEMKQSIERGYLE